MSDRNDPSQRPFTAGPLDGTAALPSGTMDDEQIQFATDGTFATTDDLLDYQNQAPDAHTVPDIMHDRPAQFYTQAPRPTRVVGNYRPISPFGGIVSPGDGLIAGFNLHETTGTDRAYVRIHDGRDTSAPIMLHISLAPGESTRDWYFPGGLKFKMGLYVEVVTGAIEGVVYTMEVEEIV